MELFSIDHIRSAVFCTVSTLTLQERVLSDVLYGEPFSGFSFEHPFQKIRSLRGQLRGAAEGSCLDTLQSTRYLKKSATVNKTVSERIQQSLF